ncbi:signal peptidase I [Sphingomonas sp. URHD0057]|uniref:signal peptidase I n=1 Tax=Sphingomonas sp. URHD0057 TaxID=1380389 RepID=UPI00049066C0|nr:signal peptidase I [Sphingomonas sp. URHD0057]
MRWPFLRGGRHDAANLPDEKPKEEGGSLLRFIVTLVLLAWALRSFIVAPFSIPSGSMLPTLYIGDYLAVAKWPYGYSRYSFPFGFPSYDGRVFSNLPARGDVVVFRHPSEDADLIKRVIGLPGDTIEVRGGDLILNGKPIPRQAMRPYAMPISANSPCKVVPPATPVVSVVRGQPYCTYAAHRETLPGGVGFTVFDQVDDGPADDFGPVKVPADHIFLMGDNRDDSLDSRFGAAEGGIGMVPMENLIGRAVFTFWSTDGSASYGKPWTWFTALRGTRIGNGYKGEAE